MDCIECGGTAGGHRVAVAFATAELVGGLCAGCETAVFGACFDRFRAASPGDCVVCDADGAYAFFEWSERVDGRATFPGDPRRDATEADVPVLCATHFHALASDATDWRAASETQ